MQSKLIMAALAATLIAGAGVSAPVIAQSAPTPTLTIFGTQKCPTDNDGNEIVVCVRRPAGEQFRIPKELRDLKVTPENESWAARANAGDRLDATGIGSCSTVGVGGASGCFGQIARQAKREKQDQKADQRAVEAALP